MYNQFLGGMGPRPATAQPMEVDPNQQNMDWAAENFGAEDAIREGMHDIIRQQMAGTRQEQMALAPKAAGTVAKGAFPQFGAAIRGTADYAMAPVKAGVKAAQNYVMGGQTTTSAASAAPATGVDVMGAFGKVAGPAGVAYNAYQNIDRGLKNASALRSALRDEDANLTSDQEMRLRNESFKAGREQARTGAATGVLAGSSLGPPGMVAGGLSGYAGGAAQYGQAYRGSPGSDNANLVRALANEQGDAIAFWNADGTMDRLRKAQRAAETGHAAANEGIRGAAQSIGRHVL